MICWPQRVRSSNARNSEQSLLVFSRCLSQLPDFLLAQAFFPFDASVLARECDHLSNRVLTMTDTNHSPRSRAFAVHQGSPEDNEVLLPLLKEAKTNLENVRSQMASTATAARANPSEAAGVASTAHNVGNDEGGFGSRPRDAVGSDDGAAAKSVHAPFSRDDTGVSGASRSRPTPKPPPPSIAAVPSQRSSGRPSPEAQRPAKTAKHDWGAAARARSTALDDDSVSDDDAVQTRNWVRAHARGGEGGNSREARYDHFGRRRGSAGDARGGRDMGGGRSRGTSAAALPPAAENVSAGGFVSAGQRLDADNARKGLPPAHASRRHPGQSDDCGGAHGGGGVRGGFIPPYVKKAFTGPGGGGQRQKPGSGTGDTTGDEPPFSEQVMQRICPHGEPVPEVLLKMDREIVEKVVSEILEKPQIVDWESIAGLQHAKAAVQELAVWPLMKPELFRGARSVPRGLLLFGPPGTGKTLIGRAVASQCRATFFSISASSLTSKWIGEGEKMVRALFAVAACCEPAVIFVDEIDSLLSARKSDGEHESSRRMKTEFLVQMDGLGGEDGRLLLIGATNRPQELDDGARRRLAKQLYIPLPCDAARRAIVVNILDADKSVSHSLSSEDLDTITAKTEGYSGSDMKHLVQEAARAPLRELFQRTGANGAVTAAAMRPIALADFKRASRQVRPSVTRADIDFHEEWNRKHGAMSRAVGEEEGDDDDGW